jgi:soluble lytic murein transglycosylase-like protein
MSIVERYRKVRVPALSGLEQVWARLEAATRAAAGAGGKKRKGPAGPSTAVAGSPKKETLALFEEACEQYDVPLDLALALGCWESTGFEEDAQSSKGAYGIMQVLPSTAAGLGENPNTVKGNIFAGVRYLGQQLKKYNNDVDLALAAYNWGPTALDKHLKAGKDLSTAPLETRKHGAGVKNLQKQFAVLLAPKPKQSAVVKDAKR